MKRLLELLTVLVLALTGISSLAFAQEKDFDGEVVSVGVVGEESEEIWRFVAEKAKKEAGIDLQIEFFTDYVIPNEALHDGSLDINAFQHTVFLEEWNDSHDGDLTPIAYTYAAPVRIYSEKYDSVDDIPESATIGIPNAPTNSAYALVTLERAGIITLDEKAGDLPTVDDIVDNPKNVDVKELDAAQIGAVLEDLDLAFIDNTFLESVDLTPEDAIYVYGDTPETINKSRVNIIAARGEDKDSPLLAKIVELYQQDDVGEVIEEVSQKGLIPAWNIMEAAGETLKD